MRICIHLPRAHTHIHTHEYAEISVYHTPLRWLIRTSEDLLNGCRKLYCITRLTDLFLRVPPFPLYLSLAPLRFQHSMQHLSPLRPRFPVSILSLSHPFHVYATFDIIKGIKPPTTRLQITYILPQSALTVCLTLHSKLK